MIFNFFRFIISLNCNPCSWGSIAGVTVADGPCHLLNTFSIIQITKSAGVKIKVNIAHPTHHLGRQLERRLTSKKCKSPPLFLFTIFFFYQHHHPQQKQQQQQQQPTETSSRSAAARSGAGAVWMTSGVR